MNEKQIIKMKVKYNLNRGDVICTMLMLVQLVLTIFFLTLF